VAMSSFYDPYHHSGGLLKWLVIIAIIIIAIWYLNNQGYIDLSSLPFEIPGLG
jgi:hypothetical protein